MSEKRFVQMKEFNGFSDICDNGKVICSVRVEYAPKLVGLLNWQQSTINKLQSIIKHIKCEENCFDYDYCCETVCSLYKEIKHLKEENEQLREINKELGDDLYNCRLNKNIIREKLKLWQDAHKKYNIYSIKDFEESFELDSKINKEKGI